MLAELLPAPVVVAETDGDLDVELYPEEERSLGRAVEKRRREFVTARACARIALGRLDVPPAPIANGPRGEPLWPPGVVGSLTHCRGYRACAVARADAFAAVGIDAEPHEPLPDGVLDAVVATPAERGIVSAAGELRLDRLLFSAKESVYKAWFPLTGRWLGFEDAELSIGERTFEARLLTEGPSGISSFAGRWAVSDGLVLTAIAVARERDSPTGEPAPD